MEAVLSIAGSDSSGGAGIQADIKTIAAHHLFAETALTALTAQNTLGVTGVLDVDPAFVTQQIDAVFEDIRPSAVKVGMVSSAAIIEAIADALERHEATNIVVDPVMVATSGARLISEDAIEALKTRLLPLADVVTPNMPEAEVLCGFAVNDDASMERAADMLAAQVPSAPTTCSWQARMRRPAGCALRASTPRTPTERAARSRPLSPAVLRRAVLWKRRCAPRRTTSAEPSPQNSIWERALVRSTICGMRRRDGDNVSFRRSTCAFPSPLRGMRRYPRPSVSFSRYRSNTQRPPMKVASTLVFWMSSISHASRLRSSTAMSASLPTSSVPSSRRRPAAAALPCV